MNLGINAIGLVCVIFVFIIIGVGVVLLISLLFKNKRGNLEPYMNYEEDNVSSDEGKKEILEKLARKEINKEEAERKLQELGDPISQLQQGQPRSKSNKGCLISVIIAVILLPILLAIVAALFFVLQKADSCCSYETYIVPKTCEMKDSTKSNSRSSYSSLDPKGEKAPYVEVQDSNMK